MKDVDKHVGGRLRMLRKERGFSLLTLAPQLNLSYQQLQKYERGQNRISASSLYELAMVLGVPISEFFFGLPNPAPGYDEETVIADGSLLRCYIQMPDHAKRVFSDIGALLAGTAQ